MFARYYWEACYLRFFWFACLFFKGNRRRLALGERGDGGMERGRTVGGTKCVREE